MNLTPSEPSTAIAIPWHSSRVDEITDVWCDQNVWRDQDAHAVSVVVIDGPRGFDSYDDIRVMLVPNGNQWSFPSGRPAADEDAVDTAARILLDTTGGLLGPVAKGHLRDTFWCLQRWGASHQSDNHSYFLWFPSLDASADLGSDDYVADVQWHRICNDPFNVSNPSVEDMSDTEDRRMKFTTNYFFYNMRGATLLHKLVSSEVGGAYEFAPSPEELTTVPAADIKASARHMLSAEADRPATSATRSTRTLSGDPNDDLIFWNGEVGAVSRLALIVWLGSRAHVDDKAWPLVLGHLAASATHPTGDNLLVEWSVLFEYKGVPLDEPVTVSLPPDLASFARRLHDWKVVRDGAVRDHLREVLTEAATFALTSVQPVCNGLVPPALIAHIVSADALMVIPSDQIDAREWAGPGTSYLSPAREWIAASTREHKSSSTRGVARRAHPEKLTSNKEAAIAAFRLRKPAAAAGAGAAAAGHIGPSDPRFDLTAAIDAVHEAAAQAERAKYHCDGCPDCIMNESYHWNERVGDPLPMARSTRPKNSESALADLWSRAPPTTAGDGAGATDVTALDIQMDILSNLPPPPAAIVLSPAESNFQLLTVEEFERMVPLASPVDEPAARLEWQRSQSRPIWCDVLGDILFLHGDTFVIKSALKLAGFKWNPTVKRWERRWSLQLAQTVMSWRLGSIVITFTPAVEARARRTL